MTDEKVVADGAVTLSTIEAPARLSNVHSSSIPNQKNPVPERGPMIKTTKLEATDLTRGLACHQCHVLKSDPEGRPQEALFKSEIMTKTRSGTNPRQV